MNTFLFLAQLVEAATPFHKRFDKGEFYRSKVIPVEGGKELSKEDLDNLINEMVAFLNDYMISQNKALCFVTPTQFIKKANWTYTNGHNLDSILIGLENGHFRFKDETTVVDNSGQILANRRLV